MLSKKLKRKWGDLKLTKEEITGARCSFFLFEK
jgi:hypothetical protein